MPIKTKADTDEGLKARRFPPRRILVPMDLTEESVESWRQAQTVAGWFHAASRRRILAWARDGFDLIVRRRRPAMPEKSWF